jgi:hypothetical protein
MTTVRWLSMHVPYRCRHAGACCSAGWEIPLERTRVPAIAGLRPDLQWLRPAPGATPDVAGVLALSANGHCIFHDSGCQLHQHLGHAALPSACQHFPRECLIDARGVSVTLSHYCPTAANLLFEHHDAVEIVDGPPVLPEGSPEGLDARNVLPPLLCDGMLMDDEGYTAWEAHCVRVLTAADERTPESVLELLRGQARQLERWRPGRDTLAERIATFSKEQTADAERRPDPLSAVIRRFLAAHAFASWFAYQGGGVGAIVGGLYRALAVLREEVARRQPADQPLAREPLHASIRQTDLRLRHLADRDQLAREAEREYRSRR